MLLKLKPDLTENQINAALQIQASVLGFPVSDTKASTLYTGQWHFV